MLPGRTHAPCRLATRPCHSPNAQPAMQAQSSDRGLVQDYADDSGDTPFSGRFWIYKDGHESKCQSGDYYQGGSLQQEPQKAFRAKTCRPHRGHEEHLALVWFIVEITRHFPTKEKKRGGTRPGRRPPERPNQRGNRSPSHARPANLRICRGQPNNGFQ